MIIRWPGVVEPGRDETTLISSIDRAPTILAAAGIEPPAEMYGLNLLETDALADRDALFGALFAHTAVDVNDPIANLKYGYAVREDGWKLILPYAPNEDVPLMNDGQVADWMHNDVELYNVLVDPHETDNMASARPELSRGDDEHPPAMVGSSLMSPQFRWCRRGTIASLRAVMSPAARARPVASACEATRARSRTE